MLNLLPALILGTIWIGSFLIATSPLILWNATEAWQKYLCFASMPILFLLSFLLLAGGLSQFAHRGIVRGVFPRKAFHPVYLMRRIYGACWTQVYYFKPLYAVFLAIPVLKKTLFRLFGYKGNSDFVIYPDTWIRDLPLLKIGQSAYLSNRSTIGTNICLSDGNIMVDSVQIGDKSLIGHLAIIGPSVIGNATEIGVGAAMGVRVRLGDNVRIGPRAGIGHGVKIGNNSEIGQSSHLGIKAQIGENIKIPAGANIPSGAVLLNQADANKYYSSETELLVSRRSELMELIKNELNDAS